MLEEDSKENEGKKELIRNRNSEETSQSSQPRERRTREANQETYQVCVPV